MSNPACTRLWEVDALREGRLGDKDARSFERHLTSCAECYQRMARDERLRELALTLPHEEPTELAMRRLRTRVLGDVATGAEARPRAWWTLVVAAAVLALAATGAWLSLRRPPSSPEAVAARPPDNPQSAAPVEPMAGAIAALAQARWTQARDHGIERVALTDGAVRVHVRPQQPGERFLVTLPDGELEVRGTTFEVAVSEGSTTRVHVDEGVVQLRLSGRAPVTLERDGTWSTTAPITPPPSAAVTPPQPRPAAAVPPTPGADDTATAYADAMSLLRAGRAEEAAAAFHALVAAHPRGAHAEDASYLEAVALARAGRADAAALAAEHHLAAFPSSFHRREAAILVARAAGQRGRCDEARTTLAPWIDSPGADVRAALGTCASDAAPAATPTP